MVVINGLDVEIVFFMEIENFVKLGKFIDMVFKDFVVGFNVDVGSDVWVYVFIFVVLNNVVIIDYIINVIIYKKDVVMMVGDSVMVIDEFVWGNVCELIV